MMKLLIWILIGYIVYAIFRKKAGEKEIPSPKGSAAETHCDPVCGTYVSEDDAVVGRLEGKRIFFCSMSCLEKYQEKLASKE